MNDELPAGWTLTRLEHVVTILDSMRIPLNKTERAQRPGQVPYYGATGQVGWVDRPLFDEELVLLGEDGAPFLRLDKPKAYVISGPAWVNNHAHVLRAVVSTTSNRFLLHYLNWFPYRGCVTGTTRLKLTQRAMRAMSVRLPPLAEQKRIVAAIEEHFSRLDFAEAALEVARSKLLALRRSVLAAAFSGRLTNPSHTINADRGQLPAGWERVTIGEVSSVVGGATPKTAVAANWGNGISWITPDDLSSHDGMYIERGRRSLTREGYESCSAQLMPAGSILFPSRAPIGYVAISSGPLCTNQGFKSFVPQASLMSEFLYWYLCFATPDIQAMGRGTTFKEISKEVALSIPLVLPPLDEQEQVVASIEEHFSRLDATGAALDAVRAKIAAFRRSVLAEAFTGRLVPQDPDDEPAAVLLARIAAERPVRPTSRKRSK